MATDFSVQELGGYVGPTGVTAVSTAGGGGALSGLADIFQAVGSSITNVYRAVNPPSPGQLVYNPQSGTYLPAGYDPSLIAKQNLAQQTSLLPIVVLVLVGALAFRLVR
jgi:hypothetical protein